jgi:hypothetical protein
VRGREDGRREPVRQLTAENIPIRKAATLLGNTVTAVSRWKLHSTRTGDQQEICLNAEFVHRGKFLNIFDRVEEEKILNVLQQPFYSRSSTLGDYRRPDGHPVVFDTLIHEAGNKIVGVIPHKSDKCGNVVSSHKVDNAKGHSNRRRVDDRWRETPKVGSLIGFIRSDQKIRSHFRFTWREYTFGMKIVIY